MHELLHSPSPSSFLAKHSTALSMHKMLHSPSPSSFLQLNTPQHCLCTKCYIHQVPPHFQLNNPPLHHSTALSMHELLHSPSPSSFLAKHFTTMSMHEITFTKFLLISSQRTQNNNIILCLSMNVTATQNDILIFSTVIQFLSHTQLQL